MSKKKNFQGYRKLLVDNWIKSIATFRTHWDRSLFSCCTESSDWDLTTCRHCRVKCCCWPGKQKCQNQWLPCNNDSITNTSAWNALSIHRSVQYRRRRLDFLMLLWSFIMQVLLANFFVHLYNRVCEIWGKIYDPFSIFFGAKWIH